MYLSLAAISLLLIAAVRARSARRPAYGGTLQMEIGAVVNSLDPAVGAANAQEAEAKAEIDSLIYEHRNPDGTFAGVSGSGPFHISGWDPGKHATLAANDDFPAGRPFVDSIDIQMGRSVHDRLLDLEVSNTDLAEIPAAQARQAAINGVRISASQPDRLLALVFLAGRAPVQDQRLRQALSESIDRSAIVDFILQKEGLPAGSLLPQWSSGTAYLFSTTADAVAAKALVAQIGASPAFVLGYDSGDPFEESVAERIAVNAHAAGLAVNVQALPAGSSAGSPGLPDARLIRLPMPSPQPQASLQSFLATLVPLAGLDPVQLPDPASAGQIYSVEQKVVGGYRVVPLVWYPQVFGLSTRLRDWQSPGPGEALPLADVWLDGPGNDLSLSEKESP
ncbi:MAG TPA: ABC transporter substrate-binding protein [Pirellulales bacterium]|nr:ABC transporter substrate-binding protein [Pirellulales bacterium]